MAGFCKQYNERMNFNEGTPEEGLCSKGPIQADKINKFHEYLLLHTVCKNFCITESTNPFSFMLCVTLMSKTVSE
jgi:hypothetical protein